MARPRYSWSLDTDGESNQGSHCNNGGDESALSCLDVVKPAANDVEKRAPSPLFSSLCCAAEVWDEMEGTLDDAAATFKQVLYAFAIGPRDIDGMADAIKDARFEIVDKIDAIELEQRRARTREKRRTGRGRASRARSKR